MKTLLLTAAAFVVASGLFSLLEWRFAARPEARWWRRGGHATDIAYWFFLPTIGKAVAKGAVVAGVVLTALCLGAHLGDGQIQGFIEGRTTWISRQPAWAQIVETVLLADFLSYWTHRLLHGPLWRIHAVHHASRELDWLSAVRNHPLNEVVEKVAVVVPLFALGFPSKLLAGATPVLGLYALTLHANVRWSFGPLRYVLASPAFHRWHHTSEERGLDKNFSGLFPVWDLLFGTFYMPKGETPERFGVREPMPEGFFAQLAYPFRRGTRVLTAGSSEG